MSIPSPEANLAQPGEDLALQAVRQAIAEHSHRPGALLPILHGIQDQLGHVPAEGVPLIAEVLNLSRAEVHGVITYYHHFRTQPPGQHVLQVCRAEACQARGGEALWAHACARLGCADTEHGGLSADGRLTLSPVYCLGLCASSPAMAVDDQVHARLSHERFDGLLARLNPVEA